ncbi:hypothetical protein N9R81_01635 [Flavobacteriales bacterium]|nr:hypothetical protein [Flavobacteriales bacterium]
MSAQVSMDLETGIVFTGYNDVRISGRSGTLFSLKDDLKTTPKIYYRLRANYTLKNRHTFSVLYAPLEVKSEGRVDKDILFNGEVFNVDADIKGFYKFNSYRFTYRYNILHRPRLAIGLGVTMKMRDARIRLSNFDKTVDRTSIGLVPLINVSMGYRLYDNLSLLIVGDGLFATQGRALDFHLATVYKLTDNFSVRGGYRFLEGGSDGSSVYGFALFHYACLGVKYAPKMKKNT